MQAFLVSGPRDTDEILIERLWELGTAGIEEQSSGLLAYFADDALTADALRRELSDVAGARVEPTAVPDVDWVARFREGFRAFSVSPFWIAPVWDDSSAAPSDHRHRLVVDPGRAFGTGTHESTALCLAALARLAEVGPLGRVADIGTGSGILAVAAAQLGARSVVACDVDPEATHSARRHAALNDVAITVVEADGARAFRPAAFDTVVANITGPLLIERAAEIARLARPQGHIVLAGLLDSERERVMAAFAAFGTAVPNVQGEWCSLTITRA